MFRRLCRDFNRFMLDRYCKGLFAKLRDDGYVVLNGTQLQAIRDDRQFASHFSGIIVNEVRCENREDTVNQVIEGINAFACAMPRGIVATPDKDNMLEKFADFENINSDRLSKAGISITHLWAKFVIHEASHAMGLHGKHFEKNLSFCRDESLVYLHGFTRFMRVGHLRSSDQVPNFIASALMKRNIVDGLRASSETLRSNTQRWSTNYLNAPGMAEWAITRANNNDIMARLWSKRDDCFFNNAIINLNTRINAELEEDRNQTPALNIVTDQDWSEEQTWLDYFEDALSKRLPRQAVQHVTQRSEIRRRYAENHYELALNYLLAHADTSLLMDDGDPYELRDAAARAAKDAFSDIREERQQIRLLKKQYPYLQARTPFLSYNNCAALILRRLARSIDHVKRYADDYRPPNDDVKITHRCPMPHEPQNKL